MNSTDWLNAIKERTEHLLDITNQKYPEFNESLDTMQELNISAMSEEQKYAFSVWDTCITVEAYIDTILQQKKKAHVKADK